VVTHRGCFGGCSFCALGAHQGKQIQSRSSQSILNEIRTITKLKSFHGTVTDLGGPGANMYQMTCQRPQGPCPRASCLFPSICKYLKTSHHAQYQLLKAAQKIPGVKHVFIASGIRYDLALKDHNYIRFLLSGNHISGALKIAPEHTNPQVLTLMRKPKADVCERFIRFYHQEAKKQGKPAYLTAYFIVSFPGSDRKAMHDLHRFARQHKLRMEQMQDFIPLPMTLAGIMYYTGINPWTGQPLLIAKTTQERNQQRRILLNKNN